MTLNGGADMEWNYSKNRISYLTTPGGWLKKLDIRRGIPQTNLKHDLPFDKKSKDKPASVK